MTRLSHSLPPFRPPPCPYFTVSLLLLTSSPLCLIFVFLNLLVSYSLSLSGTFDRLLFRPPSFAVCLYMLFPLKSLSSFLVLSLCCSNPLLRCHFCTAALLYVAEIQTSVLHVVRFSKPRLPPQVEINTQADAHINSVPHSHTRAHAFSSRSCSGSGSVAEAAWGFLCG